MIHRGLKHLVLAGSLSWLVGCTGLSSQAIKPALNLPSTTELTDVAFFPQEQYQCGPAALATALDYRGEKLTPALLTPQVYLPGREGSLQLELVSATRRAGKVAYPLQPQLSALLKEVAAGNPVLVLQNLGLDILPQWHYAVVVGYDLNTQHLILRSGTEKRRLTDIETFRNTWRRGKNWALVVTNPDQLPATVEPGRWLKASYELSNTAMADAAVAFDTAVKRWPAQSQFWMASGNVRYSLKDYDTASQRFQQGLKLHPEDGALWNNYAYSLKAQGCNDAALQAARCAVKNGSEAGQYSDTLDEMSGGQKTMFTSADNCPIVRCE